MCFPDFNFIKFDFRVKSMGNHKLSIDLNEFIKVRGHFFLENFQSRDIHSNFCEDFLSFIVLLLFYVFLLPSREFEKIEETWLQ